MGESLIALLLITAAIAIVVYWRRAYVRDAGRRRLEAPAADVIDEGAAHDIVFTRAHVWVAWVVAIAVGASLYGLARWPAVFAGSVGMIAGLLGTQFAVARVSRIRLRIEEQLADAVDLMVATLRAGAGVMKAIEFATNEARTPLRPQLEEALGRIRLGDAPRSVIHSLERRVPIETFRLFAAAMSVHWETGGSLTPALATVGRVIRDRIEVRRRVRSLSAQAMFSTMAVLGITYFIGFVMWRSNPAGVGDFLRTTIGQSLVAAAMVLQAIGLVWSAALARPRY